MNKRFQRLVVPIDGSDASKAAGKVALQLAREHGAEVLFCHAIDYAKISRDRLRLVASNSMTLAANALLDEETACATTYAVRATAEVLDGEPISAIVNYATARAADAIIMGTRGRMGLEETFFGSTAQGVFRKATVPVFVVHTGLATASPPVFRRILVAIDKSEPSIAAIAFAATLAKLEGSRLAFCHVVDPELAIDEMLKTVGGSVPIPEVWTEADISRVVADYVDGKELQNIEISVVSGHPESEILKLAAAQDADLIVVGTHGRTGLPHLLMGSVAEAIVRESPIPVVVLPPLARYSQATEPELKSAI